MNLKKRKTSIVTTHPLEKWLRRIAWSCLFSTVMFVSISIVNGLYAASHNQTTSPLLLATGIVFGMVFFFTLSPAILWLKYRKSYVKHNFENALEDIENQE